MKITRIVKVGNDEGIEATISLTLEQAQFLLNTGIAFLMQMGAAQFMDITPEEFSNLKKEKEVEETIEVPTKAPANTPEPAKGE